MAYNEKLGNRCREVIAESHNDVVEKTMFGGLCFMIDDKMCLGVMKDELMLRIDPNLAITLQEQGDCRPMDFTGKSMKGFIFVAEESIKTNTQLKRWIQHALDYNPIAKASPKKKKKTKL